MIKKPSGLKINKMSSEVRSLWEVGDVARLAPSELAEYVGVSLRTIYFWFAGMKPRKAHERLILNAIPKITAEHPGPKFEEIRPGVFAAAWWGKSPIAVETEDPAVKKARAAAEKAEDEFYARAEKANIELHKRAAANPGLAVELDRIDQDNRANPNGWRWLVEFSLILKEHGIKVPKF